MLTKEECLRALDIIYGCMEVDADSCFEVLRRLIEEHFDLLRKYKNLQDENGRLNFNNIANNINDMNYKLWLENPPLKFEELKEIHKNAIWDNKTKEWIFVYQNGDDTWFLSCDTDYDEKISFEENRYYRKEVEK